MLDGFAALFTWPLVTVYLQLMPEVAWFAVNLGKVLQRRAAVPDRRRQGIAYGIDQFGDAWFADAPRRAGR